MGKVAFREGNNHPAGTPVATVLKFTPGKYVPLNDAPLRGTGVSMLTLDGEKAQFIINDSQEVGSGLAVGLMTRHTGADAIRVLAGGPVAPETEVVVKIFAEGGFNVPKFIDAADGGVGDWVCGRTNFGNFSTAEDVLDADGNYDPSLTIFLYDEGGMRQIADES